MKLSATLFMLLIAFKAQALEVNLNHDEREIIETATPFIKETLSLLPKKVKKVLDKKRINIQFKNLNGDYQGLPDPCGTGDKFKYGNYRNRTVTIDNRFLSVIKGGKTEVQEFGCKHKNFYKTVQATLLHETAHAYDNKIFWAKRSSNDRQLRGLGFWDTDNKRRKSDNTLYSRSVDGHEYKNRKELFAINFEYFLLDSEFKCRRPGMYDYYKEEFSHEPTFNSSCEATRSINYTSDKSVKSVEVNPRKIKEIQLLIAAEGEAIFSKWGHSMFKLVVCKNETDSLEECRKNSNDHIVLSFLALINELNMSLTKGVFGKYPSRLMISDLGVVKRQYTRGEFRALKSLPLKFNEAQRERFLNQLLRVYWEYSGDYFFFTNNCADEAFKLIQVAMDKKKIYKKDIATPIGLLKYASKIGLVDEKLLEDKANAAKNGFFYESYGVKLDAIYSKVKKNFENVAWPKTIKEYSKLYPLDRRELFVAAANSTDNKRSLYSLIAIESHGKYQDDNLALKALNDYDKIENLGEEYHKMLEETVELKNTFLYGVSKEERGYGIPLAKDLETEDAIIREDSDIRRDEIMSLIREEIKRQVPSVFERNRYAKENLIILKKLIFN